MLHRATRILMIPSTVTMLATVVVNPPKWTVVQSAPPAIVAPMEAQQTQQELKELPRIIAVDERIAQRVNDLQPCVKQRLMRVAQKLPKRVTLLVTSAYRTHDEQASLQPTFGIKARPGTSAHEHGRAIDLNVLVDGKRISPRFNQKVIGEEMASEGFRYLGRRDPVHYSVPKDDINPTVTESPDLEVMTWDAMRELAQQHIAQQSGAPGGAEVATMGQPAQP